VPVGDVDAWIAEVRAFGINPIICLVSSDQLPLYDQVPGGLISYYRHSGFIVEHIPATDHQYPALTKEHLQRVWTAYQRLQKPVLVHCSAGIDPAVFGIKPRTASRTSPVRISRRPGGL